MPKSDIGKALESIVIKLECHTGITVKTIQCDGAVEFIISGSDPKMLTDPKSIRKGDPKIGYEILYGNKLNIELIFQTNCDKFGFKSCVALYLSPAFDLNGYHLNDPIIIMIFGTSSDLFDNYSFSLKLLIRRYSTK